MTQADAARAAGSSGHRLWVRLTHWLVALAVIVMLYSGFTILRAHPRLYWGETGNYLTKPLLELPISPNYKWEDKGVENRRPFFTTPGSPIDANIPITPYNQNSWARSLHFLVAWAILGGWIAYIAFGAFSGHLKRDILPGWKELAPRHLWADVVAHARMRVPTDHAGPPYNTIQKIAYSLILFIALPLMILTGMTMAPAIEANWPFLLDLFGGMQSARTIHFLTFAFVATFLLVHLAMIALTGPVRQLRGIVLGR